MASKKYQESLVDDSKSDIPSLVNRFQRFPGNNSNNGYGAQRPTRSLLTGHYPPKSNKTPDNRRKETLSPGLERGSNVPIEKTNMAKYKPLKVFQKPLCLIETDSDGKLQAHEDVLNQICQIDHTLNIVCIAGPYRTGKSYLLNRLAGSNTGFPLGSTIQAETKGIWVRCRPHPVEKDQVLLLLDTEGLSDIEKKKNNDNQILALGILLSSSFVYNTLGKFSSDDLEALSFVTEISKNIKFSDRMDIEESNSNFDRVFPTFILTLRDFTLEMKHEGKSITSDDYFEKVCLKLHPDTDQKHREKNRAPLCLMEYFKTRKCFTFDTPGGRRILSRLEDVQDSELSTDFIQETKLFTDYVYNKCPPKQMNNGFPVNGRRRFYFLHVTNVTNICFGIQFLLIGFVILAEQYVGAIRNGKVPNVENALATMIRQENTRAIEESVRIYLYEMNKQNYPTADSNTLSAAHKRCFDDALEFFRGNSMYDAGGNYHEETNSRITKEYENLRTRDQQESKKKSQQALDRMDDVIVQKIDVGCYHCKDGYKLYLKDMKELETNYCKLTGLGCKGLTEHVDRTKETPAVNVEKKEDKTDMLIKYHSDTETLTRLIMQADETLTNKDKELEAEKQKTAQAKRRQEAETRLREEQERLREAENQRYTEAYEQLKQKNEKELQNALDHMTKVLEQRFEEKERLEREGLLKEVERVNMNIEQLNTELAEYKKDGILARFCRCLGQTWDAILSFFLD